VQRGEGQQHTRPGAPLQRRGDPEIGKKNNEGKKLADRLSAAQAPWLWLVGPDLRLTFSVQYEPAMTLTASNDLPDAAASGMLPAPALHPSIRLAVTNRLRGTST
jgi:hypothetical protein